MIGNRKVIAIIPARGGSKRLPGKNLRLLNGIPLLVYSITAAQRCRKIDDIMVSTDSGEIAAIALEHGVEVDIRSEELSSDTASTVDVVKDLLTRVAGYDVCVILQPTSPLRDVEDINGSLVRFEEKSADSIISVCKAEHPPQWTNTIGLNGEMDSFLDQRDKDIPSQKLGDYYRLNGAIYCYSVPRLLAGDTAFFDTKTFAFVMPQNRSVDIDTYDDFEMAEYYLLKSIAEKS